MLMNLFSSFDPFCMFLGLTIGLNWMSSLCGFLYLPYLFWIFPTRFSSLFNLIMSSLSKEFKLVISGEKIGGYFLFNSLFLCLFFNNFLGLFPYIFTSSSHLVFTLSFSLVLWLSFMIFGWVNNTNAMFTHLVPLGTPFILMPFMVIIESISNIIRSGTLAVRLTANMISGHLLLTLLGNQGSNLSVLLCSFLLITQLALLILEFSVSIIQSYVFSILSSLYSSESNAH
uniref:ATP synthase subunit a n=1 Tax=Holarthrothrips indicus TaxID=1965675 RepID=A0A8A5L8K3_9NEOP|nr:ATP synthase F0 subunit 6 [Holarthrothrips indicus]